MSLTLLIITLFYIRIYKIIKFINVDYIEQISYFIGRNTIKLKVFISMIKILILPCDSLLAFQSSIFVLIASIYLSIDTLYDISYSSSQNGDFICYR